MNVRKFVLMDGEPGAAGGGAAAGDQSGAAAGAGAAGASAGAASGAAGGGDQGAAGGASALAKPVPIHERFPEKFRVMKTGEKGEEFDTEASMAKVLEGYTNLEKRVGSGDLPPKAPEEYAVNLPEELKGVEALKDFKLSPEFLKAAHDKGITQGQMDFMMAHYLKEAPALLEGGLQRAADQVMGNLEKAWGAEYNANLEGAMKAFDAYADPADKGKFDSIMTDPAVAYRMLAKISRELGEAGGVPAAAAGGGGDDIQALLTSEAAGNPKHPEHKAVRAKIDGYYEKKYGTAAVT